MMIMKYMLVIIYGIRKNIVMVRPRGLEPPQDFSYNDLDVARLPVPPWPRNIT